MSNIKLSPAHGVNPTIPICFFCGEDKNEIALLGRLKGDVEAPMHMCMDYVPCEKCMETFKQGILLVGTTVVQPEDNRPPIQDNVYPTGSHMVVSENFAKQLFTSDALDPVLEARRALVPEELLEMLQKAATEQEEDKKDE